MICNMLDLSNAHIPSPTCTDFGSLRFAENEYGWVVWVSPNEEDVPDWFQPIHDYAVKHSCVIINFDVDAEVMSDFQTWDW